jgi:hypothetical protein
VVGDVGRLAAACGRFDFVSGDPESPGCFRLTAAAVDGVDRSVSVGEKWVAKEDDEDDGGGGGGDRRRILTKTCD